MWLRRDTGKYQAAQVVGWTPAGNARRISKSFNTKREALAWLGEQQAALGRGARLGDKATVQDVYERWLETGEKLRGWAPATISNYQAVLDRHALPHLGHARARDVTAGDVEDLLTSLAGNGVSTSMLKRVRSYLGMVMRFATRRGIIHANPVENTQSLAAPEPEVQRWSEDEVARVVHTCLERDDQAARYALVALGTGLRTEELLGLTWAAVDLEERLVTVQQVARASGAKRLHNGGKTENALRVVPIDAFTAATLARQQEFVHELPLIRAALNEKRSAKRLEPLPWTELNLVFCTRFGTILDRATLRRAFNEIQDAAKVTRIRLYATRSTHGSLLADQGVNLHALAERLGHSDPRFTAKVYLKGSSSAHRAVADRIGELLESARCSSVAIGHTKPVTAAPVNEGGEGVDGAKVPLGTLLEPN